MLCFTSPTAKSRSPPPDTARKIASCTSFVS